MKTLIASFGFDVDFVLRRLASGRYNRVVLVSLRVSDGFERVKKAYSTLSVVCTSLKVDCILEPVSPTTLFKSARSILLYEVERASEVEIYLTGGPRILVTALLLSTLTLPEDHVLKTHVVVEGEGFECTAHVDVKTLLRRLALDERDKSIVSALEEEKLTLGEVSKRTGIPKSTLHRRLEELIEKDLVLKTEAETYMAKPFFAVTCSE